MNDNDKHKWVSKFMTLRRATPSFGRQAKLPAQQGAEFVRSNCFATPKLLALRRTNKASLQVNNL